MTEISEKIDKINWDSVGSDLDQRGHAVLTSVLTRAQCAELIDQFDQDDQYRKTVVMERQRFGSGVYKYWSYPLPRVIQNLRENLYPRLVPFANQWAKRLRSDVTYPSDLGQMQCLCSEQGQKKPTPLILRYEQGGYNTLHQDLYGDIWFPIQATCLLSEPDKDYTGGDFVLTEQRPRSQSKAIVLRPNLGDMVIFASRYRPIKGSRSYYRVVMKHGISEVHEGIRYAAGIIFHDAIN